MGLDYETRARLRRERDVAARAKIGSSRPEGRRYAKGSQITYKIPLPELERAYARSKDGCSIHALSVQLWRVWGYASQESCRKSLTRWIMARDKEMADALA